MAFGGGGGSKRRVIPLQVQTTSPGDDDPVGDAPSAAQRSLLPPKSPLAGVRRRGAPEATGGGLERMLLLRNMNVTVPLAGAERSAPAATNSRPVALVEAEEPEVSAAHNLKARKLAEARRRAESQLMAREDYTDTPEGEARRARQHERTRMREEELHTQRVVQAEKAQARAAQLQRQAEEEARLQEMYLARRREQLAEHARVAEEKERERQRALELKMTALKVEADRKAREAYEARQKQLEEEAQAEQDARNAALERAHMDVEDELASVMRVEYVAEQARRAQIEAEAREWARFEEQEAQRQREETQRRRDAQREQYEQDRARRMQIHQLQQERERAAAADKRRREQQQQQTSPLVVPPVDKIPPIEDKPRSPETARRPVPPPTARRPPPSPSMEDTPSSSVEASAPLSVISEQALTPSEVAGEPTIVATDSSESVDVDTTTDATPQVVATEPTTSDEQAGGDTGGGDDEAPSPSLSPIVADDNSTPPEPNAAAEPNEQVNATESQSSPSTAQATATQDASEGPAETNEQAAARVQDDPPVESISQLVAVPTEDASIVVQPELLSLDVLRGAGVAPVAEVLSVAAGSPASVAGLAPRDLLVDFGGVTSATPQCLAAIAGCVQQSVHQRVALVVLRPASPPAEDSTDAPTTLVQRCELWLVPRKWKGKGLLGCQLSPFKWPSTAAAPVEDTSAPSETATSAYDALVLHEVAPGALASRLGLQDGDVLARCGDLDVSRAAANAQDALAAVASHLQTHWRDARRALALVVQRWDDAAQRYAVVTITLPALADAEPLGCALTTFSQFYYPTSETATSETSETVTSTTTCCDECYYSSLASSLHAAALAGHVPCLAALVAAGGAEFLDWRDDEGRSPLFYACYARQADAARWLVAQLLASAGAYDPVGGADAYGDSPLHAAAASDSVEAVACLLETRFVADVDLANGVSQATAAHVAASAEMLRVLHGRFGADLLALDADGRMPLFYACLRDDPASVALLCELHPDFADYADSAGGNTPLHMAAWCGFRAVARALATWLPAIALFLPNQDGLDPRALAAQRGWTELAQELEQLMTAA